jgi:hypothetical protein
MGLYSHLSNGYQGLSSQLKQPGHEDDHTPPSSAKVKNGGAKPPLPIHLHGMVIKHLSTGKTNLLPYNTPISTFTIQSLIYREEIKN